MRRSILLRLIILIGLVLVPGVLSRAAAAQEPDHAPAAAAVRIEALRREIAHHDELYFRHASPEISDAAYDALRRELGALEMANPGLAGSRRGSGSDDRNGDFATALHGAPMLSLAKVYDEDALRLFFQTLPRRLGAEWARCVVEPKVDGIAVSLVYEHGRLARAVTRGNGIEGDDITENVLMIEGLPGQLDVPPGGDPPESVELRGEIYMSLDEFARLNRERDAAGEDLFAHPRNLAAGTIKSLDRDVLRERRLEVVLFAWGRWLPLDSEPVSHQSFREQLRSWGLPVVEPVRVVDDETSLQLAVRQMAARRRDLAYPIDGVVIKLDDTRLRSEMGDGVDGPRWAVAYKFPPDRVSTPLRSITWQVGRSGVLTPVAELEPVTIAGATIGRASLHNRLVIERLDLHAGDHVFLERAGEIIPYIVGVDRGRRPPNAMRFTTPVACPACGSDLRGGGDEAAISCANYACEARVTRRIAHFASGGCMDIRGLGPATIESLVAARRVLSPADLYQLRTGDLETIGIGERTAGNLLAAIEASRGAEFWRVLHGLGIPGVGATTARRLAIVFPDGAALLRATEADFAEDSDSGEAVRREVLEFVGDAAKRSTLEQLIDARVGVMEARAAPTGGLSGKVFVFTGSLDGLSRKEAAARVAAAGGRVAADVSRKTDYLVVGSEPGTKLDRARELGVEVISEKEFRELLP